ncbi:MAG: acyltransferase family protein [Acidimicrobiales bacterium]
MVTVPCAYPARKATGPPIHRRNVGQTPRRPTRKGGMVGSVMSVTAPVLPRARLDSGPCPAPALAPAVSLGPVTRAGPARVVSLDGLRALLVAGVILYHLDGGRLRSATGEVAVIVFFVLSGFLITALLLDERARSGQVRLGAFYARRIRRLLPALGVLVVAWLGVALVFGHDAWITTVPGGGSGGPIRPVTAFETAGAALAYATNWMDAFLPRLNPWTGYSPMGHLWTLAVEVQFYVLWAPVLLLVARLRSVKWWVTFIAALALAEPFWLWHEGTQRLYFGTDTRAGALILGAALACWWREGKLDWLARPPVAVVSVTTGCVGALVAGCGFMGNVTEASWCGGLVLASMSGALMVAALVTCEDDPASRMLRNRVLVWIGRRSYAIYLWSYVFNTWFRSLGVATAPLVVICTVMASDMSYRLVEAPLLRRRPVAALRSRSCVELAR